MLERLFKVAHVEVDLAEKVKRVGDRPVVARVAIDASLELERLVKVIDRFRVKRLRCVYALACLFVMAQHLVGHINKANEYK